MTVQAGDALNAVVAAPIRADAGFVVPHLRATVKPGGDPLRSQGGDAGRSFGIVISAQRCEIAAGINHPHKRGTVQIPQHFRAGASRPLQAMPPASGAINVLDVCW